MLNDVLGRVDNAHLAQADRGSPFSEVCLRLSNTHSVREPGWYPYYIQLTQYRLREHAYFVLRVVLTPRPVSTSQRVSPYCGTGS